jgi:hypothetical protein
LGLLRFNGIHVPAEFRLGKLVTALEKRFDGLGAPGTVTVFPDGIAGQRELIVRESTYEFWYHTGIAEGEAEPDVQSGRETTRLHFLRRKLFEDLATGDKTCVWKSQATTHREQVQPLLDVLRRLGPNTLLWVVEADDEHQAGSIEPIESDFIKGYVTRFAPYDGVTDIDYASWFDVCWRADEIRHSDQATPRDAAAGPSTTADFLTRSRTAIPDGMPVAEPRRTLASRIWGWFRGRSNV